MAPQSPAESAAPLTVLRVLRGQDLHDKDLVPWLDDLYYASSMSQDQRMTVISLAKCGSQREFTAEEYTTYEVAELQKRMPDDDFQRFVYLTTFASEVAFPNYLGRVLPVLWRLFFDTFPKGQVWVIRISDDWVSGIFQGEVALAARTGYDKQHPESLFPVPQEGTGLQIEAFPYYALSFMSCSVYPLIISLDVTTAFGNLLLYVPDRAFTYSVMLEGETVYQRVLWKLFHVFDDPWTFGSRGPKMQMPTHRFDPSQNTAYAAWMIGALSARMHDRARISDTLTRAQLAWTMNRIRADAQFCITSELPYMAKTFFFGFLDKAANMLSALDGTSEYETWTQLVDPAYLCHKVKPHLDTIPGSAGKYFRSLIDVAVDSLAPWGPSPEDLKGMRDSLHGYFLRKNSLSRVLGQSGQFSNDLTLLVAPLSLFLLTIPWNSVAT